jgi:hypothetical protein
VVAIFVSNDIALGERPTFGAELAVELVEEPEVDVDRLIRRAVERPDSRGRRPAAGVDAVAVEHRLGTLIGPALRLELARPVGLDAVDEPDNAAIRAGVGVRAGLARRERGRVRLDGAAGRRLVDERARVAAEQQVDDRDHEPESTTADGEPAATAVSTAAGVGYLAGVEPRTRIEGHVSSSRWPRLGPRG